MAAKMTIQTRTQLPVYTAETLAAKNPVLLKGEVVYESDTRKHKVGDGTTAWNSLPYAGGGDTPDTIRLSLVGSEMCIRDRPRTVS